MYAAALLLSGLMAVSASPLAAPAQSLNPRGSASVTSALWDGTCTYPTAVDGFNLTNFLGTWYQQAASTAFFNIGCSCVTATYTANPDGTVGVVNTCQRLGLVSSITGSAAPAPEAYGQAGVFDVQLNGAPPIQPCPGPNYIVQEFTDDYAIVQAGDFSTLFILSREQVVEDSTVEAWMARAESLGSSLTLVTKTKQTGCAST